MSQGIDGVQTVYTYEAVTEYGALHEVTETVQANGSIVPGQSTRNIEKTARLPEANSMFTPERTGR